MTNSLLLYVPFAIAVGVVVFSNNKAKKIPHLILTYFDGPGRGEATRLACAYGNIPLVDNRISYSTFLELKAEGKLPFGQVPILTIDNTTIIAQSSAIGKFVGKLAGLYPEDDIMSAKIDALIAADNDLFTGLSTLKAKDRIGFQAVTNDIAEEIWKALNDEVIPRQLQYFENILEKSPSGWLAGGDSPSMADFTFVPKLKWFEQPGHLSPDLLVKFPNILKLEKKFYDIPAVKKFYSK